MKIQDVRRQFLHYFKSNGHSIIPSSAVVPHDDPTLLFTNAGMNQFKDVFLGKSARDYKRAATSQKCIRVGGKHNDLENVGHTSRHLTFFEMLGNFSFGDYFKAEAIRFAWEVATQVFKFDPNRIWPTVFREDDEAFELWKKYVPEERITRFGEKDNFWAMGDTGPCGPCSELLYDRGSKYGNAKTPSEDPTGERFLEFWNLVFMQYNRSADGKMEPLPKPSIDTGAGLERVVALKNDVDNVFGTDILRSLIDQVEQISGIKYDEKDASKAPAFHVIADHLRCLSFAIADGVQPSNIDRGYVLRKVLRRAVRYGRGLGMEEPFLGKIFPKLVETMGEDYPELIQSKTRILEILHSEEEAFLRTLKRGGNILNNIIEFAQKHHRRITGDEAFKLKDTYGFPIEEILLIAKDADLTVDIERYQELEQEAKQRSRSVHKTTHQVASENIFADFVETNGITDFIGYDHSEAVARILGLVVNGAFVDQMNVGEEGMVIIDKTPFYAEMGGQIGDTGYITNAQSKFRVEDTKSPFKGLVTHSGKLTQGKLVLGDTVAATIDLERRQKIANNHTATHLLHWALHQVLGPHVKQAGSVVEPTRLRFDFSHHKGLTNEEIQQIEDLVNAKIRGNDAVNRYELAYDEAQKRHDIIQFFGEKYGSKVRVIDIDCSKELCGGTHTSTLGTIGYFRIAKESSIAAGIRRIEGVTGKEAEALARETTSLIESLAIQLKTQPSKIQERIEKLLEENKQLGLEVKTARKAQLENIVGSLLTKIEKVGQTNLIAATLAVGPEDVRLLAEEIISKVKSGVVVLIAVLEDKCHALVRVSDDLVAIGKNANTLVKAIAHVIDGSGGGKPNSAQAGGKAPQKAGEALNIVRELLK